MSMIASIDLTSTARAGRLDQLNFTFGAAGGAFLTDYRLQKARWSALRRRSRALIAFALVAGIAMFAAMAMGWAFGFTFAFGLLVAGSTAGLIVLIGNAASGPRYITIRNATALLTGAHNKADTQSTANGTSWSGPSLLTA